MTPKGLPRLGTHPQMTAMLHIAKLCVGIAALPQLRAWQATRTPLHHRTRHMPRRSSEITDGGSIYWVIAGAMTVRQRIERIAPATQDDGSPCAALFLDRTLIPVEARPMKAFQGWRYLTEADAPPDLSDNPAPDGLPESLRRELRALCLI